MQALFLAALVAVAAADTSLTYSVPATTIVRAPSHDSAVIKSDRVGGNFAYSVAENPAFGVVSPVVSHVQTPVATTYSVPATASIVTAAATPVVSNVEVKAVPTTYAWPHNNWQVATGSSPIVYKSESGIEKKIDQVHHAIQPVTNVVSAATYAVQQPTQQWVSSPVASTYTVQQPTQQWVSSQVAVQQPTQQWVSSPVASTYAVQQPTQQWVSSPVATTYAVPSTSSVTTVGKTATAPVWGNTLTYAAGHPWTVNNWNPNWNANWNTNWNTNTVVV